MERYYLFLQLFGLLLGGLGGGALIKFFYLRKKLGASVFLGEDAHSYDFWKEVSNDSGEAFRLANRQILALSKRITELEALAYKFEVERAQYEERIRELELRLNENINE